MGFVARDLGIDLGTSNTLVYVKGKGIVVNEPTIVVVTSDIKQRPRAVGDDAKIMLGRTTEGITAIRPMREGIINDFEMAQILIQYFIRKAIGSSYLMKPRTFLTCPSLHFAHRAPRRAGSGKGVRRAQGVSGGKAVRFRAWQRAAGVRRPAAAWWWTSAAAPRTSPSFRWAAW